MSSLWNVFTEGVESLQQAIAGPSTPKEHSLQSQLPATPVVVAGEGGVVKEGEAEGRGAAGEAVEKKKRKKKPKKVLNETFVIVRPPPATGAKRPLNLQIQLVFSAERPANQRSMSSSSIASTSTTNSLSLPLLPPDCPDDPPLSPLTPTPPNPPTRLSFLDPPHPPPSPSDPPSTPINPRRSLQIDADDPSSPPRIRSLSRSSSFTSTTSRQSLGSSSAGSAVSGMSLSALGLGTPGRTDGKGGGARRIVPMYNLSVHNVLSTVVTDAGTDTKVAKFQKKWIEILGVGYLEPLEILSTSLSSSFPSTYPLSAQTTRASISLSRPMMADPSPYEVINGSPAAQGMKTVASGIRASLDKSGMAMGNLFGKGGGEVGKENGKGGLASVPEPQNSPKKLFGKFFKKKEQGETVVVPKNERNGRIVKSPTPPNAGPGSSLGPNPPLLPETIQFSAPTFGTSPILFPSSSPFPSATGRAVRYVWTIKRWAAHKGGGSGNAWAAVPVDSKRSSCVFGDEAPGEVTFEWTRGKSRSGRVVSGAGGEMRKSSTVEGLEERLKRGGAETVSNRSTSSLANAVEQGHPRPASVLRTDSAQTSTENLRPTHLAPGSMASPNPNPNSRPNSPAMTDVRPSSMMSLNDHEDDVSDSDPEDSETPWRCTLHVPSYTRPGVYSKKASKDRERDKEGYLVGTMYPAPHHPRVVSQLKIPLDLEAVGTGLADGVASTPGSREDNEPMMSPKLGPFAQGGLFGGAPAGLPGVGAEIWLSEENIKDVVCVTAMWLVVREEVAGIGRKKK